VLTHSYHHDGVWSPPGPSSRSPQKPPPPTPFLWYRSMVLGLGERVAPPCVDPTAVRATRRQTSTAGAHPKSRCVGIPEGERVPIGTLEVQGLVTSCSHVTDNVNTKESESTKNLNPQGRHSPKLDLLRSHTHSTQQHEHLDPSRHTVVHRSHTNHALTKTTGRNP
jgi:hypothetical protein